MDRPIDIWFNHYICLYATYVSSLTVNYRPFLATSADRFVVEGLQAAASIVHVHRRPFRDRQRCNNASEEYGASNGPQHIRVYE